MYALKSHKINAETATSITYAHTKHRKEAMEDREESHTIIPEKSTEEVFKDE